MKRLDDRTRANLDVVLEDVCRTLPHGGDHACDVRSAGTDVQGGHVGRAVLEGEVKGGLRRTVKIVVAHVAGHANDLEGVRLAQRVWARPPLRVRSRSRIGDARNDIAWARPPI